MDIYFWLIDAFTNTPFCGNPAAVIFMDGYSIESHLMQLIASRLNWSQTAFLSKIEKNHFSIRWFSPRDEAPICGHATLASAHFLFEQNIVSKSSIHFDSLAGPLEVLYENPFLSLNFPAKPIVLCPLPDLLKKALGSTSIVSSYCDDLVYFVVLSSPQEVESLSINLSLLPLLPKRAVIVTAQATGQHIRGRSDYDFVSRYFAPKVGIPEDPVCGSAHCRLTPFWSDVLQKKELTAFQLSPRGGELILKNLGDRISIKGQAITVGSGVFRDIFSSAIACAA